MKKYEIKNKLRNISVASWIFYGIMATFIIVAIVLLFVSMHLCGYNLVSWMQQFGGWIILLVAIIVVLLSYYFFNKFRKGK